MISIGLDIGSVAAKGVLLIEGQRFTTISPTGWSPRETGQKLISELLEQARLERPQVKKVVATGYGRVALPETDKTVTEITCHAKGLANLLPGVRTIIDIGGQDSKVIRLSDQGKVVDFAMNDKCAAGTGRFLQVMANTLGLDVSQLAEEEDVNDLVAITSMCIVFAESEIISQLAQNRSKGGIIAGLHQSVAKRVAAMAGKLGVSPTIAFTGGVALNAGVRRALEGELKYELLTLAECQFTGALGAALIGQELG